MTNLEKAAQLIRHEIEDLEFALPKPTAQRLEEMAEELEELAGEL